MDQNVIHVPLDILDIHFVRVSFIFGYTVYSQYIEHILALFFTYFGLCIYLFFFYDYFKDVYVIPME